MIIAIAVMNNHTEKRKGNMTKIEKTLNATEFKKSFEKIFDEVTYDKKTMLIKRRNAGMIIMSKEEFSRLCALEVDSSEA